MPQVSALILNPSGEFNTAEALAGGKQLWRFPNLAPGLATKLFEPIYTDDNIEVNVCFSRFRGEIELIMLLRSFYEYCDLRVLLIQIFGGMERWIYPKWFNTFIIVEDDVWNYIYENEITGESYTIDWMNKGASSKLVKTTNRNEHIYPVRIKPLFKLTAMGDGSEKYGGTDSLPEWKLTATLEYEVEIPTFMTIMSDVLRTINSPPPIFKLNVSSAYSEYSDFTADIPEKTIRADGFEIDYKTRYFHQITDDQLDSTSNIEIELSEQVKSTDDMDSYIITTKYGPLKYGKHFRFKDDGRTLEIFTSQDDQSYIERGVTYIQEENQDGTYVKKCILTPRYRKMLDGVIKKSPSGNLVPLPQKTYSRTKDNKFIKDSQGEYVKRDNGTYEIRSDNDFQEISSDNNTKLEFSGGDLIEFYKYKCVDYGAGGCK